MSDPSVPPLLLRGVARVVDGCVHIAILEAAFRCSALLPDRGLVSLSEDALMIVDVGVGFGALVLCSALAERLGAATLGKLCTGLRVGRIDDPRALVGWHAAFLRNTALILDGLIFGLVAYSTVSRSPQGQRLGDAWAGTRVVWRRDGPDTGRSWGWVAGVGASFALILASYGIAS